MGDFSSKVLGFGWSGFFHVEVSFRAAWKFDDLSAAVQ